MPSRGISLLLLGSTTMMFGRAVGTNPILRSSTMTATTLSTLRVMTSSSSLHGVAAAAAGGGGGPMAFVGAFSVSPDSSTCSGRTKMTELGSAPRGGRGVARSTSSSLGSVDANSGFSASPRRLCRSGSVGGGSSSALTMSTTAASYSSSSSSKGKVLILGGSGFLGSNVAQRASKAGYDVVSLSRRGQPTDEGGGGAPLGGVQYVKGDARDPAVLMDLLLDDGDGPFTGVVHCIGLLLDSESGLGNYNVLASGSGSVPDESSTYDAITRQTAFNAIEAAEALAERRGRAVPFLFTSAAEAGWPDMPGGTFVEENLAPEWLRRYLAAKRTVESRLMTSDLIRPVIFRPSLIYSMDRLASLPPVGAFYVGNMIGLPFVDRPVTVQALSSAMVNSLDDEVDGKEKDVRGVQRYTEIDVLSN